MTDTPPTDFYPSAIAYRFDGRHLVSVADGSPSPAEIEFIHSQLRAMIAEEHFSCVGAKAAFNRKSYWFAVYDTLASATTAEQLARDVQAFTLARCKMQSDFTTFVTCYRAPIITSESNFEELLWMQLQMLHDIDAPSFDWDPAVSSDPEDPNFSFSIGGVSFFIVGLHPASSRVARHFAYPTIVFNAHEQFEHLREQGKFCAIQSTIRGREVDLQGQINPNLANFGEASEARQYSGKPINDEWRAPFVYHPRPNDPSRCPYHNNKRRGNK